MNIINKINNQEEQKIIITNEKNEQFVMLYAAGDLYWIMTN